VAAVTDQSQQEGGAPLLIGSSVVPLYVERRMKVYAITESEFGSLSTLNAQTTMFSSIASLVLGIAVSIWVNALFYTEMPAPAYVAKVFVAPILVLIAVAFYYLAWHARKNRTSAWSVIQAESVARASVESAAP
jgi:protein-S-isoprenylcysteine O-methyltransferase Ste14